MRAISCQVRVRYAETDAMGVAYYANYLTWFEVGRCDLLRQLGSSYRDIEHEDQIYLPVIEAHCRYKSPAHYDDVIEIKTTVTHPSRARIRFDYELARLEDRTVVATGSTLHVATTRDGKICKLPKRLTELFA
ncbi:MAG: acyl-CoA thioesterase [Acidobacteria bacterium]|nr:MAG: acyl-CoA thioesterase [Acidobacteriota bacterium]